jgi:hypothetical protein
MMNHKLIASLIALSFVPMLGMAAEYKIIPGNKASDPLAKGYTFSSNGCSESFTDIIFDNGHQKPVQANSNSPLRKGCTVTLQKHGTTPLTIKASDWKTHNVSDNGCVHGYDPTSPGWTAKLYDSVSLDITIKKDDVTRIKLVCNNKHG